MFELHGALLNPCTRNLAWHMYDCSRVRSETGSRGITWTSNSSIICGTRISTTLRFWSLRCPLDRLDHRHQSFRLSCQVVGTSRCN